MVVSKEREERDGKKESEQGDGEFLRGREEGTHAVAPFSKLNVPRFSCLSASTLLFQAD